MGAEEEGGVTNMLGCETVGCVIVMTFWYVLWNGLNFFELFKLYFHLRLITTPHVLYDHETYISFFT